MRLTSITTIPVALPFRERYVTATGSLEAREMVLLRIESDDGFAGWGDAVPLSLRNGTPLEAVRDELESACRPVLERAAIELAEAPAASGASLGSVLAACAGAGAGPQAVAAVEIALLDLLGHAHGVPAWVVIGAPAARRVECNGTLGAGEPEKVAAAAEGLVASGFTTLKVKVGRGDDLDRMRAVRESCGEGVELRIDANGAWGVEEAEASLGELEGVGLQLAEQPCPAAEELAELRRRVAVPIVADESIASEADAERVAALGACDAATLKLAKVGGVRAALRIAARVPSYLSSALDSPLGIAAAVHAAQALPSGGFAHRLAHGLATSGLFADNVADDVDLRGPGIEPPVGPGLGVEVDEQAVERLRIR